MGWSEEMFVNRFKMYADSVFRPHNVSNELNTIMPRTFYANMNEDDLRALFA